MNPNLPACWCIGVGIGFLSSAAMPAELAEKTPPNQAVVFLESLPEAKLKTLKGSGKPLLSET